MKYKEGIAALLPVYNEEKRIRYILDSLGWCDEILVLDKESTDHTLDIAREYPNVRLLSMRNMEIYHPTDVEFLYKECCYKYSMLVTASDIIHPRLSSEIRRLIDCRDFDSDAIEVPYKGFFLGIYEKYSPWYEERDIRVIKTACVSVNKTSIHSSRSLSIRSIYKITLKDPDVAYYHLTHESAYGIIDRHSRYWKGEYSSSEPLSVSIKTIIAETVKFLLFKRTFFKGPAAIALAFSFLSYYMMTYVCKWDYLYGNANAVYANLRRRILYNNDKR